MCSAAIVVHIEMATSLSTTDFLNASPEPNGSYQGNGKRRYEIASDNKTNSVGVERLENLLKQ